MQRAIFENRITEVHGNLCFVVNARNKWKQADILRVFENGRSECRNLRYVPISGYLVEFKERLEPWGRCMTECKSLYETRLQLTADEKSVILKHYPEFHWVLDKCPDLTITQVWNALPLWKQYPSQVERLLAAGFVNLALTPSIYKLGKQQRRMILDFIKKYPYEPRASLTEIRTCMKEGIEPAEFWNWRHFRSWGKVSYKCFKWMQTQPGITHLLCRVYLRDYRPACLELGKDWKDPYWQFPSDFRKQHDKVMKQLDRVRKMKRTEEQKKQQADYIKMVERFASQLVEGSGFKVYIPQDVGEIVTQARALNQCLVTMDYTKKVIEGKCVLLFITKDGEPSSTAEILPSGKIGQFYGNEEAENIYPSDKEKELAAEWIKKFYNTKRQRNVA